MRNTIENILERVTMEDLAIFTCHSCILLVINRNYHLKSYYLVSAQSVARQEQYRFQRTAKPVE